MCHKNHVLTVVAGLFLFVSGSLYAQTPQDLRFGAITSGNLTGGGEQWYRVRPTEAGLVSVETSGDLDTYLEAYDDSRNLIASDDDGGEDANARLEIFVGAGKAYLFKVRGYEDGESGPYRIWASFRPIPSAAELRFGTVVSGNLTAGGDQWYSVRPSGAGFVVVETIGSADTYLRAFDDSYRLIAENDDGGEDENARLDFFAESGKAYLFRVTGYNSGISGPYRILASFEPVPPDTARNTERSRAVAIKLGESFPVIFYAASESRWFRYDVPRNGTQFVVQTRGHLDTVLFFHDARGNLIAEDDDGGEGGNALISHRLDRGTVYIEVKGFEGVTGRCTLHAETR
ncbi:MAG: hypothetical protein LBQ69_01130 [Treponema sp.]|jgi:hypothetical protein|nr:hypothetical protein [Treponema sp.]